MGSAVEALRKRNAALKGEETGDKAPAPAKKKPETKKAATKKAAPSPKAATKKAAPKKAPAPKKPAKKAAAPKKPAKKAPAPKKPEGPARKPAKAAKAKPKKSPVPKRAREGDGLTDDERKVIGILKRLKAGELSIMNLACKFFGEKDPDNIPREGPGSLRVIRNAIRRPLLMDPPLLVRAGKGVVKLTAAGRKAQPKAAARAKSKAKKKAA